MPRKGIVKLYCFCRQPEDSRMMIGCDGCREWYHGDCVGVSEQQADIIGAWFCVKCEVGSLREQNNNLSKDYHRLLLETLSQEEEKQNLLIELNAMRKMQSTVLKAEIARLKIEKKIAMPRNNNGKADEELADKASQDEPGAEELAEQASQDEPGAEELAEQASQDEPDEVPKFEDNFTTRNSVYSSEVISEFGKSKNKVVVKGKRFSRLSLQYGIFKSQEK